MRHPRHLGGERGHRLATAIGIVIVCGLAVGTLFTLFVLPSLYTFIASDHRKGAAKREAQLTELESLK